MTDHEYIISRLDWFYDISECIINYFKKHTDADFDIAKETWRITKSQLQLFLKEHKADIYLDDAMYNYYDCISRNFQFIDDNIVANGGSFYENKHDDDTCRTCSPSRISPNRNPSSSRNNTWNNWARNIHNLVISHWRR